MRRSRHLDLDWVDHGGRSWLRVRGWTETEVRELGGLAGGELGSRLAILPSEVLEAGGDLRSLPPAAGNFTVESGSVRFVPRFPFMDGMGYSLLVYSGGQSESPEVWTIQRPSAPSAPATEVVAIYPTTAELPVNLLKVYVHFSGPMSEGWADRAVKVFREDTGEELEGAFLPPDPELWDLERRRLTMLLDPGRIKRGLVPNQEVGYPLVEGVTVKVTVAPAFRDAKGQPLKSGAERSYRIGPPFRSRTDTGLWRLKPPGAGSHDTLVVEFDRPLDHALLQHSLRVCDSNGTPLQGRGEPGAAECSWRFTPALPWEDADYQLVVDSTLEDVAGNTPVRVFDRDVTRVEDIPSEGGRVAVGFTCIPTLT